jgi:5'-nucleotidase
VNRHARLAAIVGVALVATMVPATSASAAVTPYISEIHYDNAGSDTGEAVEVTADPGTDLTGWSIVLYNGANGLSYGTLALAWTVPAGGALTVPALGMQNGAPDGLALVDATGAVVEFLSYEGTFTAADGPAGGATSTDIGVEESATTPVGDSLQKINGVWQGPLPNTFASVLGPCDVARPTAIPAVQGSGDTTPLAGTPVTLRGVVVGDLQVGGFNGFFLQDPVGDGKTATSDGIFVYAPGAVDVSLGDVVAASGIPTEFNGLTELANTSGVQVCAAGARLPAPAALDLPLGEAGFEALEGMRVAPADHLTVTEVYNLNRFGEILLSEGGVLDVPTEVAEPGAPAQAVAAENARRRVLLDDGLTTNLASAGIAPPFLSPGNPVRVGDAVQKLDDVVLSYGFGAWRLEPADGTAEGTTFTPDNSRPARPPSVGGDLKLASVNVLNYFTTLGLRGAATADELARQQAKIVAEINTLGADVIALEEIENSYRTTPTNTPDVALSTLVAALNADAGDGTWDFVPSPANLPPPAETDEITVAIIYRPDRAVPVGDSVALTDENVWFNAREPIAQTFSADGDTFTVVANHFKSKSSSGATGDNVDSGDGQGAYNGDRTREAESLVAFAAGLVASSGDPDVILLGDFNAYANEQPIDVIRGAGYIDLEHALSPGTATYVFNGEQGSLDHGLATASLTAKVTGAAPWRINSVESYAYGYNGFPALYAPDPYRASDHDPLLIGIDLQERCHGLVPTIRGTAGADRIKGTKQADVIWGGDGNDQIEGGNGNDVICGGRGDDRIEGDNGRDTLLGGFGDDRIDGGNGKDVLIGGPGLDRLDGGNGMDLKTQDGAPW